MGGWGEGLKTNSGKETKRGGRKRGAKISGKARKEEPHRPDRKLSIEVGKLRWFPHVKRGELKGNVPGGVKKKLKRELPTEPNGSRKENFARGKGSIREGRSTKVKSKDGGRGAGGGGGSG